MVNMTDTDKNDGLLYVYVAVFYIGKGIIRNIESVGNAQQMRMRLQGGRSGFGLVPAYLSDHIEEVGGAC